MREILYSEEMVKFEKTEFLNKDSYFFMKNAAQELFIFIINKFKKKQPIIALCGPGNNGGDGFIIAKKLMDVGYPVQVYFLVGNNGYKSDALKAFNEFRGKLKKIDKFKLTRKPYSHSVHQKKRKPKST